MSNNSDQELADAQNEVRIRLADSELATEELPPFFSVLGSLLHLANGVINESREEPEQRGYLLQQQQFDQGYCKYTSTVQCPLFLSFETLTQYIFLFQGAFVGVGAVMHLTGYSGEILDNTGLRAILQSQQTFSNFIIMCRIGGLEVRQIPCKHRELYLISNRPMNQILYVANDSAVFADPMRYGVDNILEQPILSIDLLVVSHRSISRINNERLPCDISEVVLQATHKEIYPLHSGVLMNTNLFSIFARRAFYLMKAMKWHFRPIHVPSQGESPFELMILPEPHTIECSVRLEHTSECVRLWCNHYMGIQAFVDATSHQISKCPLCRASFLLSHS